MTRFSVLGVLVFAAACGGASSNDLGGSGSPGGGAGGSGTPGDAVTPADGEAKYSGDYDVPVPPELAAAATYKTAEVHWTVVNGTARLAYNLPKGLVGDSIRVDFSGPFDPATNKGTLTGPAGTSECVATATTVTCTETMRGLLPIDADMELVEAIAREEYAGPVQHRIDVTQRFIGDPIGIIRFDLSTRVLQPAHGPEQDDD
ncbi:MAG: hypothetical protein KF764_33955 [Labilithrix sp.]|nr:hypothetical protein [Labilithrix sp.]MBX3220352.1 hypothetical protein [Labilithrix sp.]